MILQKTLFHWYNQKLFSTNFLRNRLPKSDYLWKDRDADAEKAFVKLKELWERLDAENLKNPGDEAKLENRFIRPVLKDVLGYMPDAQAKTPRGGKTKHPDHALFASEQSYKDARKEHLDLVAYWSKSVAVAESKYWDCPLNPPSMRAATVRENPTTQLVGYISDIYERVLTSGRHVYGILTNGKIWRLHSTKAKYWAGNFFEIDLEAIVASDSLDDFKYFYLIFGSPAFEIIPEAGKTRIEAILDGCERYSVELEEKIKERIYEKVFERISQGFVDDLKSKGIKEFDENIEHDIFEATLILLYRLLFILYAEDLELLPVKTSAYQKVSLKRLAEEMVVRLGRGELSDDIYSYWENLKTLFNRINKGHGPSELPKYNGGLFNDEGGNLERGGLFLKNNRISDLALAEALEALVVEEEDSGTPLFIDYSSLRVRHLGGIYEGLLEYKAKVATEEMFLVKANNVDSWKSRSEVEAVGGKYTVQRKIGEVFISNDSGERKTTGSYYTHDDLVDNVIQKTVRPVLEEKLKKLDKLIEELDKEKKCFKRLTSGGAAMDCKRRMDELRRLIIEAAFDIKAVDPSMGSGHFLVNTVDFIANRIYDYIGSRPDSPIMDYIDEIRENILKGIKEQGITSITPDKLTDEKLIKRVILKRCIYGVDINPMAVELAKLSLWLDSFTIGAPLSFLDHHLKCGNSLVGAYDIGKYIAPGSQRAAELHRILNHYVFINSLTDSTISEVEESVSHYKDALALQEPFRRKFNIYASQHFLKYPEGMLQAIVNLAVTGDLSNAYKSNAELYNKAQEIAKSKRFFHWKLEFPEVFFDLRGDRWDGGFDCVVSNPPWERIKLQENEFFARRSLKIALAPTAADRKRLISKLKETEPELRASYEEAKQNAEELSAYVRTCGYFPLMGRGDTNYYMVFTERGLELTSPKGRCGLVVPSGVATDDTTKLFFQHLIKEKRLSALIDFENKEGLFEDVHRSFKFSIIVMTGKELLQENITCAFYLHNTKELADAEKVFALTPDDFALFNPNTRTCPIFRSRNDMELTRKIYKQAPILIDENNSEGGNPWKIKFTALFHMTNDSGLFRTSSQLEKDGFWLGAGNIYTKGEERHLPLYEGKMVQIYDHRAAGVVVNPENIHRPAQPRQTTEEEHKDPNYSPKPQFWVSEEGTKGCFKSRIPQNLLAFKNVTSPTNERSMIASIIPFSGVGNSMPVILSESEDPVFFAGLVANLSSFALDFAARQKIGGQNLNFFIVEQFPVLPPDTYEKEFGGLKIKEFIGRRILELVYTAHDIKGFAEEFGYDGPPFSWDEERRLHLRCQLDALYFHLYGLDREEISYIMDTFPIVKRNDEAIHGAYRTKALILAYYNAYAAGNMDAWVKG